jgi:hypothetical protein
MPGFNRAIQVSAQAASLEGRAALISLLEDAGAVSVSGSVRERRWASIKDGFDIVTKDGAKYRADMDDWLLLRDGKLSVLQDSLVCNIEEEKSV